MKLPRTDRVWNRDIYPGWKFQIFQKEVLGAAILLGKEYFVIAGRREKGGRKGGDEGGGDEGGKGREERKKQAARAAAT